MSEGWGPGRWVGTKCPDFGQGVSQAIPPLLFRPGSRGGVRKLGMSLKDFGAGTPSRLSFLLADAFLVLFSLAALILIS